MIKLTPLYDTIKVANISDEEYFSSKYSDYISNSKLSLINPAQGGSVEKYLEGLSGNIQYSDSLIFGSAVHELVLQPESFEVADGVDRPTAKMGMMADELYRIDNVTDKDIIKASDKIGYYKGKMNKDKIKNVINSCDKYWEDRKLWENTPLSKTPIYLDFKSRERLANCLDSIENNKNIQSLLHPEGIFNPVPSFNERTLFIDVMASYEGKEVLLKLKAKLDNFTINCESGEVVLNDLKTTGHYLSKFDESFERYRYCRQMAMYLWMLNIYANIFFAIDNPKLSSNMLLVSTVPTYNTGIFKVSKSKIKEGFQEFTNLLKLVANINLNAS